MRLKNLFTVPRFNQSSNLVVVFTKNGRVANVQSQLQNERGSSGPAGGSPGSGAGKGGGAGGSIRESGGGLGQFGAVQEEGYFYNKGKEQLEKLRKLKQQKNEEQKQTGEEDKR